MTERAVTTNALVHCYDQIDALAADLGDNEWGVQSLCPDWDVRGVVSHLAGVEHLLTGWRPTAQDDPPPFQKMAEWDTDTADLSAGDFVARIAETHAGRRDELASLTDEDWVRPCMSPIGPVNYGRFMEVRVFDYWVHQHDITIPLGRDTDDSGPAAEIALDEVHASMGYIIGKKVGLPDGMSITFDLTGGIDRRIHARVDGRAAVVDSIEDPDVTVEADTTTFIMLACGRVDPQEQIDAGRISWSGADEWGDRAARNLRFTM